MRKIYKRIAAFHDKDFFFILFILNFSYNKIFTEKQEGKLCSLHTNISRPFHDYFFRYSLEHLKMKAFPLL